MRKSKIFLIFLFFFVLLLPNNFTTAIPEGEDTTSFSNPEEKEPDAIIPPENQSYTGVDPGVETSEENIEDEIRTLSGSFVVFDPSAGGDLYYKPYQAQTFCFRAETYTSDWEYANAVWLKFPSDWTISNVNVQGTPYCEQGGTFGEFSWEFQTNAYEVKINHKRNHAISEDHCVATYCIDLTSEPNSDPAQISWFIDGDEWGAPPNDICSWDGYAPSGYICDESSEPPGFINEAYISITPEAVYSAGCKETPQTHLFNLYNHTGENGTFNLTYHSNVEGTVSGPSSIYLASDDSQNFEVEINPSSTCFADTTLKGYINVWGNDLYNSAEITRSLSSVSTEFAQIATAPISRMDNVLASYNGRIWDIMGYGSANEVINYNPTTDSWSTITSSAPPFGINYARSGCQIGSKVFVYGDTTTPDFTGLWSYNLATNEWINETPSETLPGNAPSSGGIWAPAWVADSANNRCYLTGGASVPGGGDLTSVYVYDAIGNQWLNPLPNFITPRDFHAAFLYERPIDGHQQLCVAGGVSNPNVSLDSTQCFDLQLGFWGPENENLRNLPIKIWAMGYTQREINGKDQLWIVNGVGNDGMLVGQNMYFDTSSDAWVFTGPLESDTFYRTSAINHQGTIYHIGGSIGGFSHSGLSDKSYETNCEVCEAEKGEWINIGLGNGCPDWYRYDAEYDEETGLAYLMGGRSGIIAKGDIYAFDPETGTCTDTHVDMLTPVSNYTIARLEFPDGTRLCTFGGYHLNTSTNIDKVQCFSPTLNNIVYKENLPSAFAGYRPGGVEVVDNKAYIFGGTRLSTPPYDTAITYEYNPQTNSYTPKGAMSLARSFIITAVADDMIYAFGGDLNDGLLTAQIRAERFDPTTGTWSDSDVPDLPYALDEGQAFGFDHNSGYSLSGAVVIAGGGQWPDSTSEALLYDIGSKTYDYSFDDLNIERRNHAGFFLPGERSRMWVIGGRIDSDNPPYGTIEYYELDSGFDTFLPLILK
jgi:hypothetical protein